MPEATAKRARGRPRKAPWEKVKTERHGFRWDAEVMAFVEKTRSEMEKLLPPSVVVRFSDRATIELLLSYCQRELTAGRLDLRDLLYHSQTRNGRK